jgi:hypothetical protein
MAQGAIKKSTRTPTPKAAHSKKQISKAAGNQGKNSRKASKKRADLVQRKFTAGMTAKTEALLGERVGHLELLGGKKKKGAAKHVAKAGGSKKFG